MLRLSATVAAVAILAAASAPVWASDDLAKKHGCLACHKTDKKLVGPAYADVAKKYAGQADAEAMLAKSIRAGGKGKWGPVPMPAQPKPSDDEIKALAKWILAGAK